MPEPDTTKKPWEKFAAPPAAAPPVGAPVSRAPAPAATGPWTKWAAPTPPAAAAVTPPKKEETPFLQQETETGKAFQKEMKGDTGYQALEKLQKWSPRWDKPDQILQDPTWYGRSARYLGGELVGATHAGAGVITGGYKMLHDIASAINPEEGYKRPIGDPQKELAKDVAGVAVGIHDVGKAAWNLMRHFPEASADPENFGNTITNAAMIVDGATKGAKSVAELLKKDPAEAARTAARANQGVPSRYFRRKAFEDAYIHTKGLDIAKKVDKASKAINEEVKTHAENISSQIDTKVPTGVIDAGNEAATIQKEFQDVVKTPEKAHPVLAQMVKDAQATAPGQWSWEKTRQFRSSVGRAWGQVKGPQEVVLARVYKDLTNKLEATAKQYGLEDSWNHYNELERKTSRQFAEAIDGIRDAQSGKEVAQRLGKDSASTVELARNLSKYGLDLDEVMKYVKDSKRMLASQDKWKGTLFRMAYGTPAGVPTMLAVRGAGGGWMEGVVAGAVVGYAFTHIINMARAMKLSPDVIEHILSERELPGKMPTMVGSFPTESATGLPETTGGGGPQQETEMEMLIRNPPRGKSMSEEIQAEEAKTQEEAEAKRKKWEDTPEAERAKSLEPKKAPAEAVGREPGAKPGTTRESPIGRRTKARERVAKGREEAKRTRESEVAEAQARTLAKDVNVTQLQIPELEEYVKTKNPSAFSGLQKLRRAKSISDMEYHEALKYYVLQGFEENE